MKFGFKTSYMLLSKMSIYSLGPGPAKDLYMIIKQCGGTGGSGGLCGGSSGLCGGL